MTTVSIFHFFSHLMERRGYFGQDGKLEDFEFPEHLIAARGGQGFPDLVLKTNDSGHFTGGEFIEIKEAQSLQISSFNSTLPTTMKPVNILQRKMIEQLHELGETPEDLPDREVYYLVRGRKKVNPAPISKTVLVSGRFFETISVDELLTRAFNQVARESAKSSNFEPALSDEISVQQRAFAASRRVEGASVSVRFRVMAQVDPDANLLLENRFPAIRDNTLNLLVADESLPSGVEFFESFDWRDVPVEIEDSYAFSNLEIAFNEINPQLKTATTVSVLQHPKNGPFFLAQSSIY